jgi:hypothetical protein
MNDIAEQEELDYTDSDNESDQDQFNISAFQSTTLPFHRSIRETDELLNRRIFLPGFQSAMDRVNRNIRTYQSMLRDAQAYMRRRRALTPDIVTPGTDREYDRAYEDAHELRSTINILRNQRRNAWRRLSTMGFLEE